MRSQELLLQFKSLGIAARRPALFCIAQRIILALVIHRCLHALTLPQRAMCVGQLRRRSPLPHR
jgi:hypothetical protein